MVSCAGLVFGVVKERYMPIADNSVVPTFTMAISESNKSSPSKGGLINNDLIALGLDALDNAL